MNTIGNDQDKIIQIRRHKTSLKKGSEVFIFYFVTELGRDVIIGHEDELGNDAWDKVRKLQNQGWTYK